MKFEEVLSALREGIKVRRKSWNKRNYIVVKKDNLIVDENDYAIPFCIDDFSADDWEIVEEKKKVKLRDLTQEQFKKWIKDDCCRRNGDEKKSDCFGCIYHNVVCNLDLLMCWAEYKDMFDDKFLDQEVEIDE